MTCRPASFHGKQTGAGRGARHAVLSPFPHPLQNKDTVNTGVINWPRHGELTWQNSTEGGSFVYAYWLADRQPVGLDLFDPPDTHRDWFTQDPRAASMIELAHPDPALGMYASPSIRALKGQQILTAVCLGSCSGWYYSPIRAGYFWAGYDDLTREGRRLVRSLSDTYARPAVMVTYLVDPMSDNVPGAALDQATVVVASGSPALR